MESEERARESELQGEKSEAARSGDLRGRGRRRAAQNAPARGRRAAREVVGASATQGT